MREMKSKKGRLLAVCFLTLCLLPGCSADGVVEPEDKYEQAVREACEAADLADDSLEQAIWDLLPASLGSTSLSLRPELEGGSMDYNISKKNASRSFSDSTRIFTAQGSISVYKAGVDKTTGWFEARYDSGTSPKWDIDISWNEG